MQVSWNDWDSEDGKNGAGYLETILFFAAADVIPLIFPCVLCLVLCILNTLFSLLSCLAVDSNQEMVWRSIFSSSLTVCSSSSI